MNFKYPTNNAYFVVLAFVIVFTANTVSAAGSAGLVNGVWFSEDPVTDFREVTVFSVIHNQTDEQLQGIATLVVDGEAVGAQEVNIGSGSIKQIGILNQFSFGQHTVRMSFTAGNAAEVTFTELASENIFVVQDTDGDGIQNTTDLDDDNDGIPDLEDADPLVKQVIPKAATELSATGRDFLNKLADRFNEEEGESEKETSTTTETSREPGAIAEAFQALEDARKRGAAVVQEYEEDQREKLEAIAQVEAKDEQTAVEGFESTNAEESKKREHQIAAAGAATIGVMLEKVWVFYAEIIVLTLGVIHLLWSWFSRRFKNLGSDDEEE